MDLSKFNLEADSEKGARLQLRHPQTGEFLFVSDDDLSQQPVYVEVVGPDSKRAKRASADLMRGSMTGSSQEEGDKRAAQYIASVVTGWGNFIWKGQPVEFSRDLAEEIFTSQPWIRMQIERFQGDRANFFDKSQTD